MKYKPNFNDSRVIETATRALDSVELYTNPSKVSSISSTQLYKWMGNTSKPLGKYLFEQLLVTADRYYNSDTGVCRKYRQNAQGVKQLKIDLGLINAIPALPTKLDTELETGDITYTEKSDRIYSPLQFIPKRIRGQILNNKGYRYHYDIEAAAPTLLVQRAKKLNPELKLSNLDQYINNRSQVRKQLAIECEISEEQVKFVINALLNGGVISCHRENKTFNELNRNYDAIIKLRNNLTLSGIRSDIKQIWKELKVNFPQRYITDKRGITRSVRLTPKEKSKFYREIEREVGDVIRRELKRLKVRHLWIHDGWCCDKVVDPIAMQSKVKRELGYSILLDWSIYEE